MKSSDDLQSLVQELLVERCSEPNLLGKVAALCLTAKQATQRTISIRARLEQLENEQLRLLYLLDLDLTEADTAMHEVHDMLGLEDHPEVQAEAQLLRERHEQLQAKEAELRARGVDIDRLREKHRR
jgi:hypothetical protein